MSSLKLRSNDGKEFTTNRDVIRHILAINNIVEDLDDLSEVILDIDLSFETLDTLLEYAEYKSQNHTPAENKKFLERYYSFTTEQLYYLLMGASQQNMLKTEDGKWNDFANALFESVARYIRGKNVEEIRASFNIVDDMSPAEHQKIEEENKWLEAHRVANADPNDQ